MPPIAPLSNALHAAAQEGAAGVMASLLNAGLHRSVFNPAEPGPEGASLLARCLPMSAHPLGDAIFKELLISGLDPLAETTLPAISEGAIPYSLSSRLASAMSAPGSLPPLASAAELCVLFDHPGALRVLSSLPEERLRWLASERDALSTAAASGNLPAMALLIKAGANPNGLDSQGHAPLSRCDSAQAIERLLDLGADLGAVSSSTGKSCLNHFMSSRFGAAGKGILALISSRAKASAPTSPGAESLGDQLNDSQRSLASAAFAALAADNAPAARMAILALGEAASRVVKPSGDTLLLAACRASNWPEAARLLAFGCDICSVDSQGDSPLLLLSTSRHPRWDHREDDPFYCSRGAALADKWARSRNGGRGGKNIPWERQGPGGHALIEGFNGRLSRLGCFWTQLAPTALSRGWNPWEASGSKPVSVPGLLNAISRTHIEGPRRYSQLSGALSETPKALEFLNALLTQIPPTPAQALRALTEALDSPNLLQSLAPRTRYGSIYPALEGLAEAVEGLAQRADLSSWAPSPEFLKQAPGLAARIESFALLSPSKAPAGPRAPRI